MDFEFNEGQKILRATVRDFLRKEAPSEFVREIDEKEEFPWDLYRKFAELGMLGLAFPESYGGAGGDYIDLIILHEEVGRVGGSVAMALVGSTLLGANCIYFLGSEEQKRVYLPNFIRGQLYFSFALTEPNAGSDAASIKTTAIPDGGYYVINGSKMFITAAAVSDFVITVARTDSSGPKYKGITLFLVDRNSPGLTITPMKKLGHKAVDCSSIIYNNVRVPKENSLGETGEGWKGTMATLENEKIAVAAESLGAAEQVFQVALEYSKQRVQFGKPIGKFQAISHMLAEMATLIEAARGIVYRAAWTKSQGGRCDALAAMAKYYATDVFMRVATDGMQIMGGYGYMMDHDMQRYFREAKLGQIGAGTTQIQKEIIAKYLGL